ncbi:MAG: hypothetical protein HC927_08860 [Deltaproteobacteria bacterium]|nr:hypothetical protein [Deltaproteobacteria bacterium]
MPRGDRTESGAAGGGDDGGRLGFVEGGDGAGWERIVADGQAVIEGVEEDAWREDAACAVEEGLFVAVVGDEDGVDFRGDGGVVEGEDGGVLKGCAGGEGRVGIGEVEVHGDAGHAFDVLIEPERVAS